MLIMSLYEKMPNHEGFYIDIGAHDPVRFSNTQYFYEKGWRGINIDATPNSMKKFDILRPEDINLECAISDKDENLVYYCFEESALNSFDAVLSERRIKDNWKLKEKVTIQTQSINSILEEYLPPGQQIDFIDIDIEGMELQVLKTFDFEKYAPKYFLIEDLENVRSNLFENTYSELIDFMKSEKYYPMLKCTRTVIYARR
jgi:FkbM family methyltransferase